MIKMPKVNVEYIKLQGGIDQSTPVFSIKPGMLLDCVNYVPGISGGFDRIDGYERFDGHPSPSAGSYWLTPVTISGTLAVGNVVTGATSAATGKILQINAGQLVLGRVTGTFNSAENLTVGGVVQAVTNGVTIINSGADALTDATYLSLAANDLRNDIGAVPGSGNILGVVLYNNTVYAFRNNAGGTASVMYKATATGWQAITLPFEIAYSFGAYQPNVGTVIKGATSGAVATVRRVVNRTGTFGVSAAGTLVVDTITGTFVAAETLINNTNTATVTISIASPAVISWTGHGLQANAAVMFTTTGALPTGITAGTIYYVLASGLTANSFQIAATPGGTAITTSGTQSGTHTGYTVYATSSSTATQIALAPSGRYEFCVGNFGGSLSSVNLYGADGVNPAFEFDGTYYVPIHTGMTTDTPSHVIIHKKQLFLSFISSVQQSGLGQPYNWSPISGASEIACGQLVTGFAELPGNVLCIACRNITYQLLGSSSADWNLQIIAPEMGALPYTLQNVGDTYMLDDRGIVRIAQTLNYGNFEHTTVSRALQKTINLYRPNIIGSAVYRNRNHYRLYCNDGTGIAMWVDPGKEIGFTKFQYNTSPTCIWSSEDNSGKERVFFGDNQGFVYEANVGLSFDGAVISGAIVPVYNTARSPRYRKTYKKCVVEMVSSNYAAISLHPEFSMGDNDVADHAVLSTSIDNGAGGFWDISSWDTFYYDGKTTLMPEFSIAGAGNSLSLVIYSSTALDSGHTLNGFWVHYIVRRISR